MGLFCAKSIFIFKKNENLKERNGAAGDRYKL